MSSFVWNVPMATEWRHGLPPGGRTPENAGVYEWRRNTAGFWMYRKKGVIKHVSEQLQIPLHPVETGHLR